MREEPIRPFQTFFFSLFLTFFKVFSAYALYFDDLSGLDSIQKYCQGKAKQAEIYKKNIPLLDGRAVEDESWEKKFEELENSWLLVPLLYKDLESNSEALDTLFESIEALEKNVRNVLKEWHFDDGIYGALAQAKTLKYESFLQEEGELKDLYERLFQQWRGIIWQDHLSPRESYHRNRVKVQKIKEDIAQRKFRGYIPLQDFSIRIPRIVFIRGLEGAAMGLQHALQRPLPHIGVTYLSPFQALDQDRELTEQDGILLANALMEYSKGIQVEVRRQMGIFRFFGLFDSQESLQKKKDKWMTRRMLVDFTRSFLKCNRSRAIEILDALIFI